MTVDSILRSLGDDPYGLTTAEWLAIRGELEAMREGLLRARAWLTADDKVPPAWESEHYDAVHEASRAREEFSAWAASNPDLATSK